MSFKVKSLVILHSTDLKKTRYIFLFLVNSGIKVTVSCERFRKITQMKFIIQSEETSETLAEGDVNVVMNKGWRPIIDDLRLHVDVWKENCWTMNVWAVFGLIAGSYCLLYLTDTLLRTWYTVTYLRTVRQLGRS